MISDFKQGNSRVYTLRLDSTAYLGGIGYVTFKKNLADADNATGVVQKTGSLILDPSDSTQVLCTLTLTPANTTAMEGVYNYSFKAVSSDKSIATTPICGTVEVTIDPTRSL